MSACSTCGAFAFFGRAAPGECPFCADEIIQRKPGCSCQWEEGDSPCVVHGEHEEINDKLEETATAQSPDE